VSIQIARCGHRHRHRDHRDRPRHHPAGGLTRGEAGAQRRSWISAAPRVGAFVVASRTVRRWSPRMTPTTRRPDDVEDAGHSHPFLPSPSSGRPVSLVDQRPSARRLPRPTLMTPAPSLGGGLCWASGGSRRLVAEPVVRTCSARARFEVNEKIEYLRGNRAARGDNHVPGALAGGGRLQPRAEGCAGVVHRLPITAPPGSRYAQAEYWSWPLPSGWTKWPEATTTVSTGGSPGGGEHMSAEDITHRHRSGLAWTIR
jgi:hypothetical protein